MSGSGNASLACQARAFYGVGKYEKALECLQQLSMQPGGGDDPRLQGNLVLTEHAKGGFKRPLIIKDRITTLRNSLKTRSEKVGSVQGAFRAKESLRLDAEDEDADEDADDTETDTSVLLYNLAALNFHEKQYGASQHILHALFARIEVLEEPLAVQVCFLFLDVLLHSARGNIHTVKDRERLSHNTAALLAYLERPHAFTSTALAASEMEDKNGNGSADSLVGSGKGLETAEFTFRMHLYKAKVRLLLRDIKSSKKELKSALEIFQRELRPNPADPSASGKGGTLGGGDSDDEVAAAASTAATAGNTLMGGYDASLPPAGVANVAGLYLKANLEYLRQNYRKALKLLASCHRGEDGAMRAAYLNDMGCLHSKMGLHSVALQYFQRAVASSGQDRPASANGSPAGETPGMPLLPGGRPLETDGRVLPHTFCEIAYNTGLQLLILGRSVQAFRCFENASLVFYNRPRVWLRMAECCVHAYREEEGRREGPVRDRLVRRVLGRGPHRRLVLATRRGGDCREFQGGDGARGAAGGGLDGSVGEDARGRCTLLYAVKCLQNALFLLSVASQGGGRSRLPMTSLLGGSKLAGAGDTGGDGGSLDTSNGSVGGGEQHETVALGGSTGAASASADKKRASWQEQGDAQVEQVVLLTLSYVYLCLHEPVLALHYAELLLTRGAGWAEDEGNRVAARTYAAEALCVLGRPDEALKHLLPGGTPLSEEAGVSSLQKQCQAESKRVVVTAESFLPPEHFAARARCALHLNLANVYLLQNNLAAAEKCVGLGLAACPTSPDALRSLVFILLRTGNTSAALEALKSRRPLSLSVPPASSTMPPLPVQR